MEQPAQPASQVPDIQGSCEPKFNKLKTLLKDFIVSGEEVGAAICVNIDGKNVVDIWGGYMDEERTKPWEEDTIVNVWSSTKTVTTLCALILHERGLLDVNENVATYWPEFAQNGKENVKVRHLMSHTSGLPAWEQPATTETLYDTEKATARLAAQAPWWEPGTASGYHLLSMGHLIGEVVRRTSGKSLKQFVAEEVAGPLGADFQIGALEKDWPRIATLIPPPPFPGMGEIDPKSVAARAFTGPMPTALDALTPGWRNAEIGAANGHGTARGLLRMLSAIALDGEVDGVKLLSPKTIDLIFQEQSNGIDLVMGLPVRFGIGYLIMSKDAPMGLNPDGRICMWGGWGGSIMIMDLDNRMSICYVMNKMGEGTVGSARTAAYVAAIYEALKGDKA